MHIPGRNESFIQLGTVVKPHGIRGELKVRPCTERPDNICRYRRIYLADGKGGDVIECTNVRARVNGTSVILAVDECPDRNRAEQLVGMHLWLAVTDLPPAGPDEMYLHTLMDKRARTASGQVLGTVKGVLSGGQELLVIRDGEHEYLVPAVRTFIVTVDEDEIVLDLPSGLLEINR